MQAVDPSRSVEPLSVLEVEWPGSDSEDEPDLPPAAIPADITANGSKAQPEPAATKKLTKQQKKRAAAEKEAAIRKRV